MVQVPLAPVTVQVRPPGSAVTVYEAGVLPLPGATVMVASALPAVTVGWAGASGAERKVPDVITPVVLPVTDTLTNRPPAWVTENHNWLAAETRLVHVIPSGLVMTRLPVPEEATATKRPSPYVTDCQLLLAAETRLVQAIPSGLVMTRLLVAG